MRGRGKQRRDGTTEEREGSMNPGKMTFIKLDGLGEDAVQNRLGSDCRLLHGLTKDLGFDESRRESDATPGDADYLECFSGLDHPAQYLTAVSRDESGHVLRSGMPPHELAEAVGLRRVQAEFGLVDNRDGATPKE